MKLLLLIFLLLLPMTITFWAITHIVAIAQFERPLARYGWLAVVTFLPVLGGLIYLVAGRPKAPSRKVPPEGPPGTPST